MTYQHQEDFLRGSQEMAEINRLMIFAINRLVIAVENLKNSVLINDDNKIIFSESEAIQLNMHCDNFRLVMKFLLKSFISTHTSIVHIHMLGNEDREKNNKAVKVFGSDGMSLAREQIEKVFVITLLCSDPIKWIDIYMKDEWKRIYEYNLNQKLENENLPEWSNYYQHDFPKYIEHLKVMHNISEEEQEYIDYKFNNPGKPVPPHLKNQKIAPFPTPGLAKKDTNIEKTAKECLDRWYWEYKYLCGFSHAGFAKMRFPIASDRGFAKSSDQILEDAYTQQITEQSLWASYSASASALTELLKYFSSDLEVVVGLTKFWTLLQNESLLGRAIWNIRAKDFFTLIDN
jgi:hypothetical protein